MSDIKKVAELANVSIGTVSNAFKRPDKVSPATRERILKVSRELNYFPNQLASALVTSQTKILGLMVSYSFSANRGKAIIEFSRRAAEYGYIVMLATVNMKLEEEEEAISRFLQYRVDGVVIYGDYSETMTQHFKKLQQNNVPFIAVKRYDESYNNINVEADDAISEMVDQLQRFGHSQICAIVGNFRHKDGSLGVRAKRFETFKRVLRERGIQFTDDDLIIVEKDSKECGIEAIDKILAERRGNMPTALFCMYDHIAIGAMTRLMQRGYRIPRDISVVGYGNYEVAEYSVVSLSTVDTRETEILQQALSMLMDRIDNPEMATESKVIQHRFILRDSIGFAPNAN